MNCFDIGILALHGLVAHDGLGRVAEHLRHIEVERALAVRLLEGEVGVAGGLSDDVERCAFPFGYLADVLDVLLVDEQAHAFLAFVGDDFLGRERRVADGQLRHVDESAALFHQLGEAVDVACASMVVDADDGIHFLFAERTHQVVGTLLHLGVRTLHGVELDAARVATCVHAGDRAAAQPDAVVVAAHYHYLIALPGLFLQAVALRAVAYAAGKHDDFVVGVLLVTFLMLEGEHRPCDERLAELVAEVAGAVAGLDENLLGRLVEPLPDGQNLLPFVFFRCSWVARHIHRCACDGPGAGAAAHAVAYLAACAGAGSVEGFHGGREVVRLGFEADDALYVAHLEPVARAVVRGGKLLYDRTLSERHIIFIGGDDVMGVLLSGFLYHLEEGRRFLLAVDDEGSAEYLVPAVLAVYLCEAEDLAVGELTAELCLHLPQVLYLLGRQGESLLLVVLLQIVDVDDGLGLAVDGEDVLVEAVVEALEHGVSLPHPLQRRGERKGIL